MAIAVAKTPFDRVIEGYLGWMGADTASQLRNLDHNAASVCVAASAGLLEQVQKAVRRKVEDAIQNDKANLSVDASDLSDAKLNKIRSMAKWRATSHYLNDTVPEVLTYHCKYVPALWDEKSLLSYISNPGGYTSSEAMDYLADHQTDILETLLSNEAVLEEYKAILVDPKNSLHVIKKFRDILKDIPANDVVNVTMVRKGTEFTFRTKAAGLRMDPRSGHHDTYVDAKDRRKMKKMFGRTASYTFPEITKIVWGKKTVFEKEAA